MLINLSDVLSEQHKTVDETVQLEMDTFQSRTGTFPIVSKEPVHVVAEHVKGRELLIHVDTELCILIPCDRCLEDVKQEFDLNFTKHVDLNVSDADLGEGLDESNFISGYHLDVDKLLSNEILSGWPEKVLCKEDCKGLCPVCGQNLNTKSCDVKIRGLILECQLSVTYLRILRRCNLCQSAQRINLLKQEEIKEELTGR